MKRGIFLLIMTTISVVVGGNIGRCNLKLVIGSVTGLQAILSESMFMAGSII